MSLKPSELLAFVRGCLALVDDYLREASPKPEVRIRQFHRVTSMTLTATSSQLQSTISNETTIDWSRVASDCVAKKLSATPEFAAFTKTLIDEYSGNVTSIASGATPNNQMAFWLGNLLRRLVEHRLCGTLTDPVIEDAALLFKAELELAPYHYSCAYYIDGFFLEGQVSLDFCGANVRGIVARDFEREVDAFSGMYPPYGTLPTAALDFAIRTKNETDCYDTARRILDGIRLYQPCSAEVVRHTTVKDTVLWPGHTSSGPWLDRHLFPAIRFGLPQADEERFRFFLNRILPLLDIRKDIKDVRHMAIGLDAYRSGLLRRVEDDWRLLSTVTGLEALSSRDGERGENAYKVSIRLAKILGYVGYDSDEVVATVSQAYKFRNLIAHGSHISDEQMPKISDSFKACVSYLRELLVIYLFPEHRHKERFISLVDSALVSRTSEDSLSESIASSLTIGKHP